MMCVLPASLAHGLHLSPSLIGLRPLRTRARRTALLPPLRHRLAPQHRYYPCSTWGMALLPSSYEAGFPTRKLSLSRSSPPPEEGLFADRSRRAQTAETSSAQLQDLARLISARSEAYASSSSSSSSSARPSAVAKGSSPALTLRNTVQPSSMTMGSSKDDSQALLRKLGPEQGREGKGAKWKRALGVGRRKVTTTTGLGALVEPGEEERSDEEKEQSGGSSWDFVERELMRPRERVSEGEGRAAGAPVRRRMAVSDRQVVGVQQQRPQQQTSLKLPGEDDSDEDESSGIVYAAATK